jgi:hypothetical protein
LAISRRISSQREGPSAETENDGKCRQFSQAILLQARRSVDQTVSEMILKVARQQQNAANAKNDL